MARMTFGTAVDDDDILEVQGIEYHMQPVGMRAMRKLLDQRIALQQAQRATTTNGDGEPTTADLGVAREQFDASVELILSAVRPDDRERLRAHIDESVGPQLIAQMVVALTSGLTDLDPTQRPSLSDGSSATGSTSTAGAAVEVSTPMT